MILEVNLSNHFYCHVWPKEPHKKSKFKDSKGEANSKEEEYNNVMCWKEPQGQAQLGHQFRELWNMDPTPSTLIHISTFLIIL